MAKTKFKGMLVNTVGELPKTGDQAPGFELVKNDLSVLSINSFKGKTVVLNIFPSVDTGVCAASVRRFNKEAANMKNTVVLCISKDLPFAQSRFCGSEGIDNVIMLSDFRNPDFANSYGVLLLDGPLCGLLARSVIILNTEGKVIYSQLVDEITEEPDYGSALKAINTI